MCVPCPRRGPRLATGVARRHGAYWVGTRPFDRSPTRCNETPREIVAAFARAVRVAHSRITLVSALHSRLEPRTHSSGDWSWSLGPTRSLVS